MHTLLRKRDDKSAITRRFLPPDPRRTGKNILILLVSRTHVILVVPFLVLSAPDDLARQRRNDRRESGGGSDETIAPVAAIFLQQRTPPTSIFDSESSNGASGTTISVIGAHPRHPDSGGMGCRSTRRDLTTTRLPCRYAFHSSPRAFYKSHRRRHHTYRDMKATSGHRSKTTAMTKNKEYRPLPAPLSLPSPSRR